MAKEGEILLLSTEDAYTNVPSRLGKTVKHLNRLQDKLGKDHDLAVLKGFLVKHLNDPGNSDFTVAFVQFPNPETFSAAP